MTLLKQARPIYFAAARRKVQVNIGNHGTRLYMLHEKFGYVKCIWDPLKGINEHD